jgi:hypothetical protein
VSISLFRLLLWSNPRASDLDFIAGENQKYHTESELHIDLSPPRLKDEPWRIPNGSAVQGGSHG